MKKEKAAPAFTLQDATGNKVALKDLRGRNVIVYFYPRDNTPGCTKEACGFRDVWKDMQKQDAVVLGVSPDSAASHQKFATQYQLPFTLLCDPDKKVMEKIRCLGRENDVRQKDGGRYSLDGLDWSQRQSKKALESGSPRPPIIRPKCSKLCGRDKIPLCHPVGHAVRVWHCALSRY